MKTKTIIFGLAVAILGAISIVQAKAQSLDQSTVTVLADDKASTIKVIYNYNSKDNVEVKFSDAEGLILNDKIRASSFDSGFVKKYQVDRSRKDELWVEIKNPELSVTYVLTTNKEGKWVAEFQKATQYRTLALR